MNLNKIETSIDTAEKALQDAQEALTEARARQERGAKVRVRDGAATKAALKRAAREVQAALRAAS